MQAKASVDDLYRIPDNGKAELVGGKLVLMSPTGGKPGRAAGKIYASLDRHERTAGGGYAFPHNVGFLVSLPDRDSFSPDAAFYTGAVVDENLLEGAPVFAVEVRSKHDYGEAAERQIAEKIADYFRAGTLVVWDVDVLREHAVSVYRAGSPGQATIYRRGEIAEAEPAVPGWRLPVDEIFA